MNNIIGGYKFSSTKNLDMALTHSSFSSNNYERLEFLGDSILDFLVAEILFKNNNLAEAELTRARAHLVSEENLCKVFDKLEISQFVKIGKSLRQITKAIKGDVLESIIGAIYLESGIDACKQFILNNFELSVCETKDHKTLFQEFAQKYKYVYEYVLEKTEGPAHALVFYMSLLVNGEKVAQASAKSKMEAEKLCAEIALKYFEKENK